jgi:hypothetical protein
MTTNKKAAGLGTRTASTATDKANYADLSAAAQRARLLDVLRCGPISTIDARRNLDVMHPAMRVRELRVAGHPIETVWIEQATDAGRLHRVALYVLTAGGAKHGAE